MLILLRKNSAILLTHLSAESTTIIPPAMSQATRGGGAYGVGTGFDADDAGEENEEEELYEDVVEESGVPLEGNAGEDNDKDFTRTEKTSVAATFAKESIDWRVDSLLRKLLLTADLWIEIRGLRSGKARDCHGEVSRMSLSLMASSVCSPFSFYGERSAYIPSFDLAWLDSKHYLVYLCRQTRSEVFDQKTASPVHWLLSTACQSTLAPLRR
jgi:hypothetical protein